MKIALNSYTGYGAWMTLRLLEEGHQVKYFLSEEEYSNILKGICPKPTIISGKLKELPDYSKFDVSIFDLTGKEKQADISSIGCPTIGDGSLNKRLEEDRLYGIEIMEMAGINVPEYKTFTDTSAAKAYIAETKKRYVYKPNGGQGQDTATTYVSEDSDDMLEYIDELFSKSKGSPFLLQEFISGIEVSIEGWFNGSDFYLVNFTLEEKKFMNKNKGPNTGCAGNLVGIFNNQEPKIFKEGLKKAADVLAILGYRGMIDLNTIVTEDKAYGLEWTPRFGYDASAAFIQCYNGNFGQMLCDIASGKAPEQSFRAEYCAGVRLSIPPYPSEIKNKHPEGVPISGLELEPEELLSTFMYDVQVQNKKLVSAGHSGLLLVPMGVGSVPADAFASMQSKVDNIKIPDVQIRTDIEESVMKRYNQLVEWNWI